IPDNWAVLAFGPSLQVGFLAGRVLASTGNPQVEGIVFPIVRGLALAHDFPLPLEAQESYTLVVTLIMRRKSGFRKARTGDFDRIVSVYTSAGGRGPSRPWSRRPARSRAISPATSRLMSSY